MLNVFLEVLAQVTGFLATVVFPISFAFVGVLKFMEKRMKKTVETITMPRVEQSALTEPPPWMKEMYGVEASVGSNPTSTVIPQEENRGEIEEKLSSSLVRDVFFETVEEPRKEKKGVEAKEKKLTLEELLSHHIASARFYIKLRLPQKAKLRILGRDWDVNDAYIEIGSEEPKKQEKPEDEHVEESEVEVPEIEGWKLPEEAVEEEPELEEEEVLEEE